MYIIDVLNLSCLKYVYKDEMHIHNAPIREMILLNISIDLCYEKEH